MTYIVSAFFNGGVIFASDRRTNAGLDNVSRFGKMETWSDPGFYCVTCCFAGILSVCQEMKKEIGAILARNNGDENIGFFENLNQIGARVRHAKKEAIRKIDEEINTDISILFGGQFIGESTRIFLMYSAGNFIEATDDTPFFQAGEHKYGKPIIDANDIQNMSDVDATEVIERSFDATLRSNLSVGMPLDFHTYYVWQPKARNTTLNNPG